LGAWQDIISDISEYEGLSKSIDDIAALLKLLHAVASFLDMKGFGKTRVAALRIITDINAIMRDRYDLEEITDDYCLLASQYLELGYSGKAGLALDKARCAISDSGLSVLASPKLQVEYSRYFHTIGDVHKAEESLVQAHAAITERLHTGEPQAIDTEEMLRLTVSAFTAYSKTYLEQGKPHEAMVYAKRALRVLTRIWKREERRQLQQQSSTFSRNSGGNEESSALLPAGQEESNAKSGPALWSLIRPMFYSLEHLSNIYAHVGMFQDTIYYAEQAQKVAENSNSKNLNTEGLLLLSSAWHRAGVTDKATTYLQQASSFGSTINETQCLLLLKCRLAKMYELQGDIESELKAYAEAEAMLKRITAPSYIAEIDRVVDPALILEAKMSKLTITKGMAGTAIKPPTARKAITTKKVASVIRPPKTRTRKDQPVARGAPRTRKQEATSTKSAAVSSSCNQCLPLESMKGMLMRQKADAYLSRSLLEEAKVCLSEASSIAHTVSDAAQQHLANARQLFHQGLQLLTADAVYSVVQDSTISFPALTAAGKSTETAATTKAVELKKGAGPNTRGTSTVRKTALSWIELLKQAQSHLHEAYTLAVRVSSSRTIQSIASFMNVASLLLSTAGISKIKAIHPSISVSSFELAKALNLCWERDLARLEASQVPTKEADMKWPEVANQKLADNDVTTLCTVTASFQKEFIDIIPSSWTVVSIAVSDNKHELLLTKLEAGHSPFVLRLPLGRNSSRDADEEVFDFQQGKAELLRIIEAANNSAHGARDVSGREAKISWWAERDELNERLEELLQNMENVWLGGFRGMFSQKLRRKELLARFQKTFQNILDKHLPSRQKTGKRTKAPSKVSLEPRILELFVGIGDPFCPEADLDEPLMDLLYFVVDILQFQGEHNAYDEIDFDSMVLETLDALRCYHQAEAECSETDARRHTILILDQELHSFPWESLPCMQGHAVSRLPSIACLRDRILAQQGTEARPEGHYVSASSIAYILNPGQDLKTTQATFSQELQSQPLWEGIIQRRPEEAEIKDMLENKDLYLYFGHGSGAQYIRSKTIKKLTKCATTFLMGCSSASLTEVGEFSPYGPPMSYMLAGSPAVVGTLWDVTDKDIDRFAAKTFEEWGLFKNEEVEEVVVQKTPGRKGKRRANEAEEARPQSRQKVSLVEAVALGRSACNYRYLTAAAAVVYGVPVYIKE
jgi:separase